MTATKSVHVWFITVVLAFGAYTGASGQTETAQPVGESEAASSAAVAQTVVVFGASGKIGGMIVSEALNRGHEVIGISRNPGSLSIDHPSFSSRKGDVTSVESFHNVTTGADAVIISVQGNGDGNLPENSTHARSAATAVAALTGVEGAPYVLQIGGATTMYETEEAMLAHMTNAPGKGTPMHGMFFGHLVALTTYRNSDIDWTVLTPPFGIKGWTPGGITDTTRTGSYRTSTSDIFTDESGNPAGIYVADLAVAAVDEIENRQFERQRFTVAN